MLNLYYNVYSKCERLPIFGRFIRSLRYPLKRILFYQNSKNLQYWQARINRVISCPDNQCIPRVLNAGKTISGYQVMHNGIKVITGSYYGEAIRLLLEQNRGVHEPQEERVFQEVLKHIHPGSVMIELGAYWGFYSMWFHKEIANAICYLVEPELSNLHYGQSNFKLNDMHGHFIHGSIDSKPSTTSSVQVVSVDSLAAHYKIECIHLLHADIQGNEYAMLVGAEKMLTTNRIDYIFLSTHSNDLHEQCRSLLIQQDYTIIASANLDETYSTDGILVAKRRDIAEPPYISISANRVSKTSLEGIMT